MIMAIQPRASSGIGSIAHMVTQPTRTSVSGPTMANELVHAIFATSAMLARIAGALVDVAEAARIVVTARAVTPEAVYQVYADAAVRARITGALVDVRLAVHAREARLALARVPIDAVDAARLILARIRVALVDVDLAVDAGRALRTTALVAVDQVLARATELARRTGALVDLRAAQRTRVARMAGAGERVLAVDALAVVARRRFAIVDVDLAARACRQYANRAVDIIHKIFCELKFSTQY